jgi:hypothetical protein
VSRVEVVQSMRRGIFGDFVVLGSQYRDRNGELHWYVALFPEHIAQPHPRIHHVLRREIPEGAAQNEQEAILEAISLWESEPASRPN